MTHLVSEFFANRATIRTVAFAAVSWLVLCGPSFGATPVPCTDDAPTLVLGRPITNPAPADRNDIMDLFNSYSWTLDDKDPTGFEELFTNDAVYETCTGGTSVQIYRTTSKAELHQVITQQFATLTSLVFQTRHFVANTVLNVDKDNVEGKATLLVTIQRGGEFESAPETDYTGTLKALIVKDGGVWRFKKLTLFTDLPEFITKAR
jgi:hypothetical protein